MITPEQDVQFRVASQIFAELRGQLDRGEISLQSFWSRLIIETRKPGMRATWDYLLSQPQNKETLESLKRIFNRIGLPAPWEARQ